MNYLGRIGKLLATLATVSPSDEDRLWNAWLNLTKREARDLQTLLASDVRKEFKARALIVLLAPELRVLPFRWDDTQHSLHNYLFLRWLEVKAIPQELLRFAGELICQNIDMVLRERDKELLEALFEYNKFILQFLAVLPEDDELATRLFSRYQINDPVAFWNMDDSSGYNPLLYILRAEGVPDKWKVLADTQMRDRIVAEIEGREQPRNDYEIALRCYTSHIQMANYDGREGYSRELFASQIRFITELPGIENYDRELFSDWQVGHILDGITGDALRETRHKLARLTVLRNTEHSTFSAWHLESRRAAEMMLQEFGAEDQELAAQLNATLAEANEREAATVEAQRQQQQKVEGVLSQMK